MNTKRVVLDTNLLISFLITKDYSFIDKLIEGNKIQLIFSKELIEEFTEVTSREKFRKYFPPDDVGLLLRLFDVYGVFIEVISDVNLCGDKKENFLLNVSVDGNADYLVTGDNDLLDLRCIGSTDIITISEFKERLLSC